MLSLVDDGLLAVEVDEPLEGQGVPRHIPGQVLDGLRVIRRHRLSDVRGESGMPPRHQPRGQLLGDGVLLDEPRQEPLAEETHQRLLVPTREGVERSIVRECAAGHEQVQVDMPLEEVAGGGERDHDPGP